MKSILKSLLAILVGMVTAMLLILVIQLISSKMYPLPEGLSPENAQAMSEWVMSLPISAFILLLASYFVATFDGVMLACWLAPNQPRAHGLVVFALLAASAALNLVTITHPSWFIGATLVIYLLAFGLGDWMGQRLHNQRLARATSVK